MPSTMPTMAVSTGVLFIPEAMRAELPETQITVSPVAGAHSVKGDDEPILSSTLRVHMLQHQKLLALKPRVLARGNHVADNTRQDHAGVPSCAVRFAPPG